MSITKRIAYLAGFLTLTATIGCHHTVAKNQAQPATPAAAPSATLAANPAYVARGQATTLTWQTANASDVNIQGLGANLPPAGSRSIYPPDSTTYELTAKGPGGTADASARVTVNTPYAAASNSGGPVDMAFADAVQDVYFEYDRFNIRSDDMSKIQRDAQYLKEHQRLRVLIAGHCDERGSEEYNLALGVKRADAVQKALVDLGVPKQTLQTVSYGKERPFCDQRNERCWSENRRDHFTQQ